MASLRTVAGQSHPLNRFMRSHTFNRADCNSLAVNPFQVNVTLSCCRLFRIAPWFFGSVVAGRAGLGRIQFPAALSNGCERFLLFVLVTLGTNEPKRQSAGVVTRPASCHLVSH